MSRDKLGHFRGQPRDIPGQTVSRARDGRDKPLYIGAVLSRARAASGRRVG